MNQSVAIIDNIHSAGKENQYVIYVMKESMPVLYHLVKDYMVSSMLYKIQELFSNEN